jgi:uncharacterized protein (TIGR03083 family)
VTLSFADVLDRSAVIHAADLVADLVANPEVIAAWTRESSCAGMTVGGLTRHLVSQTIYAADLLRADPALGADARTISLLDHYAEAAWLHEDLDSDTNRFVREKSDAQAAEGPDVAAALQRDALARLPDALADPPATTFIPWQGWRLPTDDFLVTRLMEMVVHSDDLAASVGVPAPDFGAAVLEPVLGLLTALAVRRHGQDAVVRTLTRPQRAPESISAF